MMATQKQHLQDRIDQVKDGSLRITEQPSGVYVERAQDEFRAAGFNVAEAVPWDAIAARAFELRADEEE
jgi:hypothetical protein